MESLVDRQLLLTYNDLYPNEELPALDLLLKKFRKSILLETANFFAELKGDNERFNTTKAFFSNFFHRDNANYANEKYEQINQLGQKIGVGFVIHNMISSLMFFNAVFALENNDDIEEIPNLEFERIIFDVLLILNQLQVKSESTLNKTIENAPKHLNLAALNVCGNLSQNELLNPRLASLWKTQLIKGVLLFTFLESNQKFDVLLKYFLEKFGFKEWREYFTHYAPLANAVISATKQGFIEISNESNPFLDHFVLQKKESVDLLDFRKIRTSPLFIYNHSQYRFIFSLFVIEKVYSGMYFDLKAINDKLTIGKIPDLRKDMTTYFSEKYLMPEIINNIFSNESVKKIKELDLEGFTDFYLRHQHMIMLIESKDILIDDKIKFSRDFNLIYDTLQTKLYKKPKKNKPEERAVGVKQLINNIKFVLDKQIKDKNNEDIDYDIEKTLIFPIILTYNSSLDTLGLNYILRSWFADELAVLKEEGYNISKVKPVVIVNIDTLIEYEDHFKNDNDLLFKLINEYIAFTVADEEIWNSTRGKGTFATYSENMHIPFSHYANIHFLKQSNKEVVSSRLFNIGKIIFPESSNS